MWPRGCVRENWALTWPPIPVCKLGFKTMLFWYLLVWLLQGELACDLNTISFLSGKKMQKSRQGISGSTSTWAAMWISTLPVLQSGVLWCWAMKAGWLATRWILRLRSLEWPRATSRLATRLTSSSSTLTCKCMWVWCVSVCRREIAFQAQFLITWEYVESRWAKWPADIFLFPTCPFPEVA